ncbi:hypothetical protein TheetDRAFT_3339, partial [Thermoanaerobacter ethanolicus JW 200]
IFDNYKNLIELVDKYIDIVTDFIEKLKNEFFIGNCI